MHLENQREPADRTANSPKSDWLGGASFSEHNDLRDDAQRRLARKVAAGAGLSVALASVLVVVALGHGGGA